MDLRTGLSTSFSTGGYVQFTSPKGLGLIGYGSPTDPTLRRFNLNGSLEQVYPTSFPDGGAVTQGFRESPDGTMILMTTKAGFELVDNAGRPLRYLAPPAGKVACRGPFSWDASGITVACDTPIPGNGIAPGRETLWRLSVSGDPPVQLSAASANGATGVWWVGSQTIIEQVACGTSWLATLNPHGYPTRIDITGVPADAAVDGVGVYQNRLAITVRSGCAGQPGRGLPGMTLDWYDPSSNAISPLFTKPGWIDAVRFWAAP
jgi:hypothetical protein